MLQYQGIHDWFTYFLQVSTIVITLLYWYFKIWFLYVQVPNSLYRKLKRYCSNLYKKSIGRWWWKIVNYEFIYEATKCALWRKNMLQIFFWWWWRWNSFSFTIKNGIEMRNMSQRHQQTKNQNTAEVHQWVFKTARKSIIRRRASADHEQKSVLVQW